MSMNVEIPLALQPVVAEMVTKGGHDNEDALVSALIQMAIPAFANSNEIRRQMRLSIEDERAGRVKEADFSRARQQLIAELDGNGQPKQ
ncbi:MAG: hypothetical protein CMJ64_03295 [Planctomycetaceae bacterium]|nr:hypothetical protein [Planctomycetaceae bacterium]